jgi:hypothetical protein
MEITYVNQKEYTKNKEILLKTDFRQFAISLCRRISRFLSNSREASNFDFVSVEPAVVDKLTTSQSLRRIFTSTSAGSDDSDSYKENL